MVARRWRIVGCAAAAVAGLTACDGSGGSGVDAADDADPGDARALDGPAPDAACDYTSPNTCPTAVEVVGIAGDAGNDVRTVHGLTSRFFKVRVDDSVGAPAMLSYTATLESPPGMVFELRVYPGDATGPTCAATPTTGTGSPPTVHEAWADGLADDSRWRGPEVRYVSGAECGTAATWTLTLAGHT